MGRPKVMGVSGVEFQVGNGPEIGDQVFDMSWSAFVNNGYEVRVVVRDPYFNLKNVIVGSEDENQFRYLKEGRKKILPVKFRFKLNDDYKTDQQVAYLTDMHSVGVGSDAKLIFIGIDPLSFLLNRGNSSGKYYEGSVSDVIRQVVEEYSNPPGATINVSKTKDNNKGRWFMHRQDPKTFIKSILDWSSSITNNKSRWIVSSGWDSDEQRPRINIKEEADLKGMDLDVYVLSSSDQNPKDVRKWYLSMNNFTSAFQAKLAVGGISAISGRYIDTKSLRDKATVRDDNTENKVNVKQGADRAFTKPGDVDWSTFIWPVPEFNDGRVGIKYEDYIDGRARQMFMNMLGMSMNMTIDIDPDPIVQDSEKLGVTTCTIHSEDLNRDFYFIHGKWIVNGFDHYYNKNTGWRTKISVYRIDHDAESKKIG